MPKIPESPQQHHPAPVAAGPQGTPWARSRKGNLWRIAGGRTLTVFPRQGGGYLCHSLRVGPHDFPGG
jgi:hypothetical protein